MYWGIGILLLLALLSGAGFCCRRRRAARKVCAIEKCKRTELVNELLQPFGYVYDSCEGIVKTTRDAWQREFGFCTAYDQSAVYFNMVYDREPVYFYYEGKTWLLEFWKGQYGMNAGGEIGLYHADGILSEKHLKKTLFESASDRELLPMEMVVYEKGERALSTSGNHWWLTGFVVGAYCRPEDLKMEAAVTFPNEDMREAFVAGLRKCGYHKCDIKICGLKVCFRFKKPYSRQYRGLLPWRRAWTQWKNRMFCRMFRMVTKPFTCAVEQILYLYFFLPAAFRRMFCMRRNRRQKFSGRVRRL